MLDFCCNMVPMSQKQHKKKKKEVMARHSNTESVLADGNIIVYIGNFAFTK